MGECDLVHVLKDEYCVYVLLPSFFGAAFIILGLYIRILMTATRLVRLIQAQEAHLPSQVILPTSTLRARAVRYLALSSIVSNYFK